MKPVDSTQVQAAIREAWTLELETIQPHTGGMNSRTWVVQAGSRRWVAKAVPESGASRFVSGLAVAAIVDAAGIPAGAPEPTPDGRTWIAIDAHVVALLRFVEGQALAGEDPAEQRLMGATLARAHRALIGEDVADAGSFHWLDAGAPHMDIEPWIRPAIRQAVGAYESLPPSRLATGLLHTDPAPEAFLLDDVSGTCGLIDWDTGLVGPLMYDVASAVMYLGGPGRARAFLDAYAAVGTVPSAEIDRCLDTMLRLRWAVQADYFARRLATNDLTGIADPAENRMGLDDARRAIG